MYNVSFELGLQIFITIILFFSVKGEFLGNMYFNLLNSNKISVQLNRNRRTYIYNKLFKQYIKYRKNHE